MESSLGQFCFVLFCVFFFFWARWHFLGGGGGEQKLTGVFWVVEVLKVWTFKASVARVVAKKGLNSRNEAMVLSEHTENMKAGITCQLFSIWIQQRRNLRAFQDFCPAEGWLCWENYRKRDKFASFLGLSHRAWPRTDGKCQEMEGLYLKKKREARSETKPGSFCSKQWSSPGAEGWRELGWEARWAGSTQPGRWFIKQRRRKKIACNSQN